VPAGRSSLGETGRYAAATIVLLRGGEEA
jgi:hypothetical protein